jgi:hypothetical protein
MKRFIILLLAICSPALADVATIPANLSSRDVADWAIIHGHVGSGTGALPAVGPAGTRYTDISTPTEPLEYRSDGSAWQPISSSGSGSSAALASHVATVVDPHGASMTVSEEILIGSGTPDASITHSATGTLTLASYTVIISELATPTGSIATFTLWGDANSGILKVWDGSAWRSLW